ncbi:hypothetical protein OIU85_005828, partial [Salix viminalis]
LPLPVNSLYGLRKPKPPAALTERNPTLEEEQEEEDIEKHQNQNQSDPSTPLQAFLESNAEAIESLNSLLQQKLENGQDEEALKIVQLLVAAQPEVTEWKFLMARLLNEMGRAQDARNVFEEILVANPLSFEALFENALLMDRLGEGEAVIRRLQEALDIAEEENKVKEARDVRLIMAQIQFLQKNVEEALKSYQELSKEDPKDFRPYVCRGMIYSLLDRNEEAKQQFAKYRELSPKKFEVEGYLRTLVIEDEAFLGDYKVLNICSITGYKLQVNPINGLFTREVSRKTVEFEIFTIGCDRGAGSWRKIDPGYPYDQELYGLTSESVCADGVIHWRHRLFDQEILLAFDLQQEKFQIIKVPKEALRFQLMKQVKGCLVLMGHVTSGYNRNKIDLWILEDRRDQVWMKETVLFPSYSSCLWPVGSFKTGLILLAQHGGANPAAWAAYYCDLETKNICMIHVPELKSVKLPCGEVGKPSGVVLTVHAENLLSLTSNAYEHAGKKG